MRANKIKMKKEETNITSKLFEHDKNFGCVVAGCDEAGRGPLAGPVVCAAVVMPLNEIMDGINDSKSLSESKREELYDLIIKSAVEYSIEIIDCKTIDEINILNATKLGMARAVKRLKTPDLILIDAVKIESDKKIVPIIKGDQKSYNIAAASIIAKVTRDRIMKEMDKEFPGYFFYKNKGYCTKQHIEALKTLGICSQHRKSFLSNFFDILPEIKEDIIGKTDEKRNQQ